MFFRTVYKSGQIFLPFCHNPRVLQTDGRTNRILIARPRLHCMQRCKNHTTKVDTGKTILIFACYIHDGAEL